MGFPETGINTLIRNNINSVETFLNEKHAGHYFVYNLTESEYDSAERFGRQFRQFPIEDHCAPNLLDTFLLVKEMSVFLGSDPLNVVAVHCRAGKGRTGLVVSCLLLYLQISAHADQAMRMFSFARSLDGQQGVEKVSQIRFV